MNLQFDAYPFKVLKKAKPGKWEILYVGVWLRFEWGIRLNGGGYLYGAAPCRYIYIGPLTFRKYLTK